MKNIHIIPTDKPSRFIINWEKDLCYKSKPYLMEGTQHIYITSDEEIKEGDYFIRDGSIHKCFRVHKTDIEFLTSIDSVYCGSNTFWSKEFCKKIILTTDLELQKDGVQSIDDEFLEWFVKNLSCEEVEVEKEQYYTFVGMKKYPMIPNYKIIIPKEEPKREFVGNASKWNMEDFEEPKPFKDMLSTTEDKWNEFKHSPFPSKKEPFKHKVEIIPAEEILANRSNAYEFIDFDKQETLEEGLDRIREQHPIWIDDFGFELGAKWQQERSYSEEEVIDIAKQAFVLGANFGLIGTFNEWFEQFKKK